MQIPLRLPTVFAAVVLFPFCGLVALGQTASTPASQTPQSSAGGHPTAAVSEVTIPGPLRSFLRMAGISQKVSPEEVMPLLARNVYVQGYIGWQERGRPTEFLILLGRYVNQAKELAQMAGPGETIRIANCAEAEPLLRTLGYRLRQECGHKDAWLLTSDPERAFLTIDSGFPLPALEEAIREDKEFSYHFPSTRVPLLFTESDWKGLIKGGRRDYDVVELIIRHPMLARLYWAVSRVDDETRVALQESVGLRKLLPLAADLDFYGSHISIRSGRVQVPGGPSAEGRWRELVGAGPDSPGEFVLKLLSRDNGWLAAYFDSLSRISSQQQQHFVEAHRLKTFYAAFRGSDQSDAARPAFRLAPGLLLLLTRVQWDAQGQPLVPGGLDVWKEILGQKSESKVVRDWGRRAARWTHPDQLLEALFAFSRMDAELSPLQMYLTFAELDSTRPSGHSLKPETLRLMAKRFKEYSDQYLIFSEFPELDDASIASFVNTADSIDRISNHTLRGNAMGTFQANVGLWQIFARQGQISRAKLNASWQEMLKPFAQLGSLAQLFDAGRNSVTATLEAATGKRYVSQDEIIELLAGPRQSDPEAQRVHAEIARAIRTAMDGQRLVSLDALRALGDGLQDTSVNRSSLLPLAAELREFEMPRPIFTSSERTEWAAGIYNNRHTDLQMQTDLSKVLKSSSVSRSQLEEARGQLASFLRDTLVGLNYAYYEPPGSQLLRANPLFVRSHDFSGETVAGVEGLWRAPQLFGQGSPAGGGAHFVGSLADLPYGLSEAEQDFIAPENVQALIWREAVPSLLTSAIVPRWWNVSANELHAVTLYQLAGEELLSSASGPNEELRERVVSILSDRMLPRKLSWLAQNLRAGNTSEILSHTTPADTFYLTAEFRRRFPGDTASLGPSGQELERLLKRYPNELGWSRLSRDFGVPHRTLAQSYARELLNLKPFPAFSGYSSRLMAESWDSNNLYWARLADERGYPPVVLNLLVPELTRRMVGKIFATDFEDWPALLRAMREAGEDFRQGKVAVLPATSAAVNQTPFN
ncbi:MAG TPA: hypothetical protein VFB00_06795 [Terriglobales bacterium]|nr:hypothetical protein [Terriglobales bacterium]